MHPSTIPRPSSIIHPQSTIHHPSTIPRPPSIIHHPSMQPDGQQSIIVHNSPLIRSAIFALISKFNGITSI
jgi:hypothetical protein